MESHCLESQPRGDEAERQSPPDPVSFWRGWLNLRFRFHEVAGRPNPREA
jgi:hypothetical protein